MIQNIDVDAKCPNCNAKLNVFYASYLIPLGSDEDYETEFELEFDCPNNCTYDDSIMDQLQSKLQKLVDEYYTKNMNIESENIEKITS